MSEAEAPRVLTPTQALAFREDHWSKGLGSVSLTAEYLNRLVPHQCDQMLGVLGDQLRGLGGDRARRAHLLKRYPAVQVIATVNAATNNYSSGTFWPHLQGQLGIRNDQGFQTDWGEAFIANLRRLGLPAFDAADSDAGSRFVGRILLHSGVPTACLPDLFDLVSRRRSLEPDLDAVSFVSWAAARAETGQLTGVDKPVVRFLRYGGVFAADVLDRVFELLDDVQAGNDGASIPLPARFAETAIKLRAEGRMRIRAERSRGQRQSPRITLDPYGQGPVLHLPPQTDANGRAIWLVTMSGDQRQHVAESAWPSTTAPTRALNVPVTEPTRLVSVARSGVDRTHNIGFVDDVDRLVAFTEDGTHLPNALALPSGPTWLVTPCSPHELLVEGDLRIVAEGALPPGWSQWAVTLVDLAATRSVQVPGGRVHAIRDFSAARIDLGMPLDGVQTVNGEPVYADVPNVVLPSDLATKSDWQLSVLDEAGRAVYSGAVISGRELRGELGSGGPLLGTYTFRVRGPWGRGAMRTAFIAYGLSVTSEPALRSLARDGLAPATVRFAAPVGMAVEPSTLSLRADEIRGTVTVTGGGRQVALVSSPSRMWVAFAGPNQLPRPSIGTVQLVNEDLRENAGDLLLRVGDKEGPTLDVRSGSTAVQRLEPGAPRQGVFRYNLTQLSDTLARHPHLTVTLGEEPVIPLASIRPRRLFRSVALAGRALEFEDCADIDGLVAVVYLMRAPWRAPAAVPISGGRAELTAAFQNAGPLLVAARIEDPWAPEPIPTWPEPRSATVVDAGGYYSAGDDEETAISAFLAGYGALPPAVSDVSRLWTVRAYLPALALGDRRFPVTDGIDELIHRQPRAALETFAASAVPTEALPELAIRSGLAWASLHDAHDDIPPEWTTRAALPSALLSAADEEWSPEEVDAAAEVCGPSVAAILDGADPFAAAGRFDAGADLFAAEQGQRAAFLAMMGLVPQGLLSADSRVMAAIELIPNRGDSRANWLSENARGLLQAAERLIRTLNPDVMPAVLARHHPTYDRGWRAFPAVSLSLAIVARQAARGSEPARELISSVRFGWADFARIAPQLVTTDLILAELLVAGSESRKAA